MRSTSEGDRQVEAPGACAGRPGASCFGVAASPHDTTVMAKASPWVQACGLPGQLRGENLSTNDLTPSHDPFSLLSTPSPFWRPPTRRVPPAAPAAHAPPRPPPVVGKQDRVIQPTKSRFASRGRQLK